MTLILCLTCKEVFAYVNRTRKCPCGKTTVTYISNREFQVEPQAVYFHLNDLTEIAGAMVKMNIPGKKVRFDIEIAAVLSHKL